MSQRIKGNSHFLHLILNTDRDQSLALLKTLTRSQTDALTEIIYNIFNLPLKSNIKIQLNKRKKLYNKLTNKKSFIIRKQLINKHRRQILQTLKLIKNNLIKVLQ
jgi:hypothetical protein